MLNGMRVGLKGAAIKVVLFVIILSFALAGAGGFLGHRSEPVAVTVNGVKISQASVDQGSKNERERLQKQYGSHFDLLASNPNFAKQIRSQVISELISDTLLSQAIADMGLAVSDSQVKNEIRSMKEFQVAGKFNNAYYLSLLQRANYTPQQFGERVKHDVVRRQFLQMLTDSEFVTDPEITSASRLETQIRKASILTINLSNFKADKVSKQAIQAFYENNKAKFQAPPEVRVNYVVLDNANLGSKSKISEKGIQQYYATHIADYQHGERRKVAHILIKGVSQNSKQKAVAILAQLKKGANFGQLAKEKSDDTFSAKNNGVLNWFAKGVMDPAFDKATFSLTKASPLSGIVKSKFGYHIIKLIDIQKEKTTPLADVKSEIIARIKKDKISDIYYDLQQKLSDAAFESPDSLDEAARTIHAKVQHSKFFTAEHASGVLANKAVLKLVFGRHFREQGMNSDVLELGDNKAIVVRIDKYKPSAALPVSEVSTSISAQLKQQQLQGKAKVFVEQLMSKLNHGKSIKNELASKKLTFSPVRIFKRFMNDQDHQITEKVFQLAKPSEGKTVFGWTGTSVGGFAVIKLQKVSVPNANASLKSQLASVLLRSSSEATYEDLMNLLMANAKIEYADK